MHSEFTGEEKSMQGYKNNQSRNQAAYPALRAQSFHLFGSFLSFFQNCFPDNNLSCCAFSPSQLCLFFNLGCNITHTHPFISFKL